MRVVITMQKTSMHHTRTLTRVLIQRRKWFFYLPRHSCAEVQCVGEFNWNVPRTILQHIFHLHCVGIVALIDRGFTKWSMKATGSCWMQCLFARTSTLQLHETLEIDIKIVITSGSAWASCAATTYLRNTSSVIYGSKLFAPLHPFSAFVVTESTRYSRSCVIVSPNLRNVVMELGARDIWISSNFYSRKFTTNSLVL